MGEIIKLHCNACRAKWECMTGCGLQHGRKENIIAAFQAAERTQVLEWLKKCPVPFYDFRYQIAPCGFCHKPVSVPVLRRMEGDDFFAGACPICGRQLPLPEKPSDIICPVCGSTSLTACEAGHWD